MFRDLLGSDDGGQRVVASDTDAHHDTPEDDQTDHGHGGRGGGQGLRKGGEDDEDQLEPVHLLPPDQIGQNTEADLTDDGPSRRCDLDGCIRVGGDGSWLARRRLPVHDSQHRGHQINGEDVVGIGEETDPGDDTGPDVVPPEGGFVDFREGETSTLVGVSDVGVVIVEVV